MLKTKSLSGKLVEIAYIKLVLETYYNMNKIFKQITQIKSKFMTK